MQHTTSMFDDKIKTIQIFHDHQTTLESAKFLARDYYMIKKLAINLAANSVGIEI